MEHNKLGIASTVLSAVLVVVHLLHLCLILYDPMAFWFFFPLSSLYCVVVPVSLSLSIAAAFQKNRDLYFAKLGAVLWIAIPASFLFLILLASLLEALNLIPPDAVAVPLALTILLVITIGWITIRKSRDRC